MICLLMKNGNATAHHSSIMKEASRLYRVLLWMVTIVVALLLCFLIIKLYPFYRSFLLFLGGLFLPFIIAGLIAYLLHPVIDFLAAWRLPRWLSILIIYTLFFGLTGFLLYKGFPVLISQVKEFSHNLPALTQRYDYYVQFMYERTAFLPETVHDQMDSILHGLEQRAEGFLKDLLHIWNRLPQVVIFLVVTPVIVFYMLKDTDKIGNAGLMLLPRRYRGNVKSLVLRIDNNLGYYIRGVLLVSCIVSLLTWTAFTLIQTTIFLGISFIGRSNEYHSIFRSYHRGRTCYSRRNNYQPENCSPCWNHGFYYSIDRREPAFSFHRRKKHPYPSASNHFRLACRRGTWGYYWYDCCCSLSDDY